MILGVGEGISLGDALSFAAARVWTVGGVRGVRRTVIPGESTSLEAECQDETGDCSVPKYADSSLEVLSSVLMYVFERGVLRVRDGVRGSSGEGKGM